MRPKLSAAGRIPSRGILHSASFMARSYSFPLFLTLLDSLIDSKSISSVMWVLSGGKSYKGIISSYQKAFIKESPTPRPSFLDPKCAIPFLNKGKSQPSEPRKSKKHSLADHLIWVTLCSSGTPMQKTVVLFNLLFQLNCFSQTIEPNDQSNSETKGEISLLATKDMASRILELIGVPIPSIQVSNKIDEALTGCETGIFNAQLTLSVLDEPPKELDVSSLFKEISLVNHVLSGSRSIFMSQEIIVQLLFEYYPELNNLEYFPDSIKLEVNVCQSSGQTRTHYFILDEDYFKEMKLFFFQQKAPNRPKSLQVPPDSFFKPFGLEVLSDLSLMDRVLNCGWEQIQVDDVHQKISFLQFQKALLTNPIISWALNASRINPPAKIRISFGTIELLFKVKVYLNNNLFYSGTLRTKLEGESLSRQLRNTEVQNSVQKTIREYSKMTFKSTKIIQPVKLKALMGVIDVSYHLPLAEILHQLDCLTILKTKENVGFLVRIIQNPYQVPRNVVYQQKGSTFPLDEHLSFIQNLQANPEMLSEEKINMIVNLQQS